MRQQSGAICGLFGRNRQYWWAADGIRNPRTQPIRFSVNLDFSQHLAALRNSRNLTQQQLADKIGVHVVQSRR
jgi:Helix-turn-helix